MGSHLQPRFIVAGGLVLCTVTLALFAVSESRAENAAASKSTNSAIRYDRDIRPLLSDRCFRCHGRDNKTRAANLRLDLREVATAVREGGAPIVPGKPEASELWRRVTSDDPQVHMPPASSNKKSLSPEERELVRRWIAEGAPYEPHWAFVPPARSAVPEVRDASWCRTPVDRFILASLERQNIKPSPEAPRELLIRRLFLDLTGLPPTPQEIDAWMKDTRADAYERWIDKLLSEEPYRTRYAERMTVPWLDAARYADTCGIHMDAGRQMWLWRDWTLNAFRENKRFDQFVTEQIAGDLLPNATESQRIASGFNRNHVTTDEGGAISDEYLVEYGVDRANTTGSVFLALTVGCARCHEHKYDPISQEDYYRFFAFFNSIEEPGLYSQSPDPNRALEPFLTVSTPEQKVQLKSLKRKMSRAKADIDAPQFQDDLRRDEFVLDTIKRAGLTWEPTRVIDAASLYGATLAIQSDGSILAKGRNPDRDEHFITLQTDARDLRMMMLEALTDPTLVKTRVGRAPNGNAVLTAVEAEARSIKDPSKSAPVRFIWAWADIEQANGDFGVVNVLDYWDDRGWAVDSIDRKGSRVALLLADKPFGYEGGTELRVRLQYDSPFPQHTLGRVRLSLAHFANTGLDLLPIASGGWSQAGPFPAASKDAAYATAFGPEQDPQLSASRKFGSSQLPWRFDEKLKDGQVNTIGAEGVNVSYVARRIACANDRKIELSLGSDDGFVLFVNGTQVASRQADRGAAPDQDKVAVSLHAGMNTVVLKVVNTGGPSGFYARNVDKADTLAGDLIAAMVPDSARPAELKTRFRQAWSDQYSPGYRAQRALLAATQKQIADVESQQPRTMVMQELAQPRETFVLVRGQYDKPDKNRRVTRSVPEALGKLPSGTPSNRLGLAEWLTSADNPLVARVAVNRMWEMLFGAGLVRTSEDFGMQGEWPSHPELLDWLAVEFRESGWDVQHMLRLMLTSSVYRESSNVRPELHEQDPDNRLLAFYPRRRLAAEFVRDQALYVSGLLVEKLGGPSVKPYQPDGLWQEVAMLQSNTRVFKQGEGNDLWRRSLYTYWKRACPPPSLMTFDAPTREACTIRRAITNTPLQALVLWNDEQYVEAARMLAARTLQEPGTEQQRIIQIFRRCTGRTPDDVELKKVTEALGAFRERYRGKPEDAAQLIKVGASTAPKNLEAPELAAWTMIASTLLNLSATITQS